MTLHAISLKFLIPEVGQQEHKHSTELKAKSFPWAWIQMFLSQHVKQGSRVLRGVIYLDYQKEIWLLFCSGSKEDPL